MTYEDVQQVKHEEWISVKDSLPECGDEIVLALVNGKYENITFVNGVVLATYYEEEKQWLIEEYPLFENPSVSYWMPIPELPIDKMDGDNSE